MSCDEHIDLGRLTEHTDFRRRVVELSRSEELPIDANTWRDTIVFVETGEVELECVAGQCRRFSAGAVLCLLPPVRVLRNGSSKPARLIAVSRRDSKPSRGPAG